MGHKNGQHGRLTLILELLCFQLIKVRKMLTDVLLTVTGEEIKAVARETLAARKGLSQLQFSCPVRLRDSRSLVQV